MKNTLPHILNYETTIFDPKKNWKVRYDIRQLRKNSNTYKHKIYKHKIK